VADKANAANVLIFGFYAARMLRLSRPPRTRGVEHGGLCRT